MRDAGKIKPGPAPAGYRVTGSVEGSDGLEQVYHSLAMDRLRGVWMSQDQKPEEHTMACESAMAVMDLLSQVGWQGPRLGWQGL